MLHNWSHKKIPPPKKSKRFDKSMTIDTTFSISIVVYMKKNCGFCLEFSLNLNKRYRFTCYFIALDVIDTFLTSLMPYLLIFLLYNRPDRTNDTRGPAKTTIHRSTYSINSRFSSSSRYFFFIYHIYRVPIENVLYSRPVQYKPKIWLYSELLV